VQLELNDILSLINGVLQWVTIGVDCRRTISFCLVPVYVPSLKNPNIPILIACSEWWVDCPYLVLPITLQVLLSWKLVLRLV
jgi:hypothetical protein